jgi:hypothetical protein
VSWGAGGVAGREAEISRLGRRHDGYVRHRLGLELDNPRLELRIDAPQERADIEIEERAIVIHDAAGLGPGRQRKERPMLKRLHHVGPGSEPRGEIHFGQSGRGP